MPTARGRRSQGAPRLLPQLFSGSRQHRSAWTGRAGPKEEGCARRCRLLHSLSSPSTRPDRRMIRPPAAPVVSSVVHYPIYTPAISEGLMGVSDFICGEGIGCVYFRVAHRAEIQAAESAPSWGQHPCGKRMTL
jgi:hypothetical protein